MSVGRINFRSIFGGRPSGDREGDCDEGDDCNLVDIGEGFGGDDLGDAPFPAEVEGDNLSFVGELTLMVEFTLLLLVEPDDLGLNLNLDEVSHVNLDGDGDRITGRLQL